MAVSSQTPQDLAALRERVRAFIDNEVLPQENPQIVRDVDALDLLAADLRTRARAAGVYAPQLPVAWGGLGLGWEACCEIFEEAGRSLLGPIAMQCAAPDQPNMLLLQLLGTASQQARYLAPLADGIQRACFAMTEPAPGTGSDPGMLRTEARRVGDGWELHGHKLFISGGVKADFALVPARTEQGVTLFIVEAKTAGYRVVRDVGTVTGYQLGGHAEIVFDSCRLAADAVLGEVGQGLRYAQLRLEPARLSHCMRFIGRASRAIEIAQRYVIERESFGSRLADLQQVQAMVADSHIDLHAARLVTRDCARKLDAGLSVKHESAMAKVFVSEAVGRVADRAVQLLGALGVSDDSPVSMIWREARPFRIYDGANELHRATLGKRILRQQLRP